VIVLKNKGNVEKKIIKNNYKLKKVKTEKIKAFKEECKNIDDSRISKKTTYKIWDIITVTFLAILADCNDWEEIQQFAELKYDWLRSFLLLTGGVPSAVTYERVMAIIDPKQLEKLMVYFIQNVHKRFTLDKDIISIDGKVDSSSGRKASATNEEIKNLNVLNVYSKNHGMCIYSEPIENKTNEIPTVEKIIDYINVKNAIVTWDALNTQKDNVAKVIENNGDYVVALKGNHELFYKEVGLYFNEDMLNVMRSGAKGVYSMHYEKSHSSLIKYEYFQTEDIKWFEDLPKWKGLKSFGLVLKTTECDKEITRVKKDGKKIKKIERVKAIETRYYISSLLCNIYLFSESIRSHWQVENNLHWHLDYTFKADDNTTLNKQALYNLQIIKKGALALLSRVKYNYKTSLKLLRKRISQNTEKEMEKIFNIKTF